MNRHELVSLLLAWYEKNARALPWREGKEPYHVWLSEIMLQQTRVEAVKAYYLRFLRELPSVEALAAVPEEKLMKLWEGLGYYNRARNLQKAAKWIVKENQGVFPSEYNEILNLPGVGAYTAGAIASICFNQATPAVDGNVLRVMARITEDFACVDEPFVKKKIAVELEQLYLDEIECPPESRGNFTQSLMELGATVCLPGGPPKCDICPAQHLCVAHKNGTELKLPVRAKRRERKKEDRTVFLLINADKIAIRQRTEKGLLSGLWELPNVSGKKSAAEATAIAAQWCHPITIEKSISRIHIFTHIQWHMTCYLLHCKVSEQGNLLPDDLTWVTRTRIEEEIPLPTAFKMFVDEIES